MHRPTLPGRTSLFTAAGLTLFAAFSLVITPSAHSAQIPLQRVQVAPDVFLPEKRAVADHGPPQAERSELAQLPAGIGVR